MPSLADLRKEYTRHGLIESEMHPDGVLQFGLWFEEALASGLPEPNAMTVATCTPQGKPSARILLLKHYDEAGFTFFTSYVGRKAKELEDNPFAAMVFFWHDLERQVRIEGEVAKISRAESEEYFNSRPVGSRIGAWASEQSCVMQGREELERRWREVESRYADGNIPLPDTWGGYRLFPSTIEFWQGRPSRMHDRILYTRDGNLWNLSRLGP